MIFYDNVDSFLDELRRNVSSAMQQNATKSFFFLPGVRDI